MTTKVNNIYGAAIVLIFFTILNSCLKENYEEINGNGLTRSTQLSGDVFIIDSIKFSAPIVEGKNFIISFTGSQPDIQNGDIAIIQKSGGYIVEVSELAIEANEISFTGEPADLLDVFEQYNLEDEITLTLGQSGNSTVKNNKYVYLHDGVKIIDGNILIDSLILYSGQVNGKVLSLLVDDGEVSYSPVITQLIDVRTKPPGTTGIHRLRFTSRGDLDFSNNYILKTSGELSYSDTIKLAEIEYSRYSFGPVPIVIKLEFFIGFEIETSGSAGLSSAYNSSGNVELGGEYYNGNWTTLWMAEDEPESDSVIWTKNTDTFLKIFLETKISYSIANDTGPVIGFESFYNFNGLVKRPEWDLTIYSGFRGNLNFIMDPFGNTVGDLQGETDKWEVQLSENSGNVPNEPPQALFKVSPSSGDITTVFIFDPSDSTDDEDPVDSLEMRWDWDNDGHWDTDFDKLETVLHQFFVAGDYHVNLQVRDMKGMVDDTISLVRVLNAEVGPLASFSVNFEKGTPSTVFVFDASESQNYTGQNNKLKLRWDWDNDGVFDTPYTNSRAAVHTFTELGDYNVRLQVMDTEGYLDDTIRMVRILRENFPPEARFTVTPDDGFGFVTTVFEFDASATTDPDDAPEALRFRWDWENDGIWDTEFLETRQITHSYDVVGIYTVKLEAVDEPGLNSFFTHPVAVYPDNSSPIASFEIFPESGDTETIFTIDASTSSDREDDFADLEARWDWENDGTWDTDFSINKTVEHVFSISGEYIVKLEIKDSGGLTSVATDTVNITEVNTPPVADFTVDPETGGTTTIFTFDASGSYDETDDLSVLEARWDWNNDGVWDTSYSTDKTATSLFTVTGTYTVVLEVKDTGGLMGTTSKEIIIE